MNHSLQFQSETEGSEQQMPGVAALARIALLMRLFV